jgi:hypothetical protein
LKKEAIAGFLQLLELTEKPGYIAMIDPAKHRGVGLRFLAQILAP